MAGFCAASSVKLGLVKSLLANVDCNVNAISQAGYQAIAAPGSQLFYALTILLTIYVAVFGLRLLLGLAPLRVGDLSLSALKIGLVLALATSWPTYQVLLYETLFRGPEQFAASMLGAVLHGSPFDGLQIVYDKLQAAAGMASQQGQPGAAPAAPGALFAAFSLNTAALLILLSTLGAILAAKIVLGLLLALGPIFVAFLLFDGTRGVFEGWLRAALAFALVPLFATLALSVQLALVEPMLAGLTATPDTATASAIFILAIVSAIVSLAGVVGILIAGASLKLQRRGNHDSIASPVGADRSAEAATAAAPVAPAQPLQPRVAAVSTAAAALARRDARLEGAEPPRRFSLGVRGGADGPDAARPPGPNYRRPARPRRTASSARRDK